MLLKTAFFAFLATAVHASHMGYLHEEIVLTCHANNATDKMEQVAVLMHEYEKCSPEMMHYEQLIAELKEPRNGTVDEVARKNCAKVASTKTCMSKIFDAGALCTTGEEDILFNYIVASHINDYMCYEEDGKTRLSKFVDDGGLECYYSRPEKFTDCSRYNPAGKKAAFEYLLRCVIDELKACSNPAAVRAQGMMEYIRSVLPSSSNKLPPL